MFWVFLAAFRIKRPYKNIGFPASRRAVAKRLKRERKNEMKRSEVLTEIKWAGWHGNLDKAAALIRQKGIGAAASRKAYIDGQKAKERGEPCGCSACVKKGAKE
jgi:hypothetical protein